MGAQWLAPLKHILLLLCQLIIHNLLLQCLNHFLLALVETVLHVVLTLNHYRMVHWFVNVILLTHLDIQQRLLLQIIVTQPRVRQNTLHVASLQVLADLFRCLLLLLVITSMVRLWLFFVTAHVLRQRVQVQWRHKLHYLLFVGFTHRKVSSRFNILIRVFTIKTVFIITFWVTRFERSFESTHNLVESVRGKRLKIVLFIDVVNWDAPVHLQTVQEEK